MNCFRHVPDYRMPKQRLIGNVIAQTPTLDSLSWYLFQATLIRLVWERPINRIPKISKTLRRRKEGWKEDSMCWLIPWLSQALVRSGGSPIEPFSLMVLPELACTHLSSWKFIPTGYLLLDCCSGRCARQILAFNPVEARLQRTKDGTGYACQWQEGSRKHSYSASLCGHWPSLPQPAGGRAWVCRCAHVEQG